MNLFMARWDPRYLRFVFTEEDKNSDQRVAATVAQTNLGKQYLADTLRCANIEPGTVTEKNIRSMDSEREEQKKGKLLLNLKNSEEQTI